MKLTPYLYCIAFMGIVKPGLTKPVLQPLSSLDYSVDANEALSDAMESMNIQQQEVTTGEILNHLLSVNETIASPEQMDMVSRILDDENVSCSNVRMLCQIDTLLRRISENLAEDGITDAATQVDMEKFNTLLVRVLSTMDKDMLQTYFPGATSLEDDEKEFSFWEEKGSEYQSFMKLAVELESLLKNREEFSPSEIVSPFIIGDERLKKEAIQNLIDSPSFQLKPLNKQGKFYEFLNRIMEKVQDSTKIEDKNTAAITIPLNGVLAHNRAELPELNSKDVVDTNAAIEDTNTNLIKFIEKKEEEMMVMNAVLRSLLGDLLGIVLDLPGKLLGLGGKGSNSGSGITITIGLGGKSGKSNVDDDYEEYDETPRGSIARATPTTSTAARRRPTPN